MAKNKIDVTPILRDIDNQASNAVERATNALYVEASSPGQVPIWKGPTRDSTQKSLDLGGEVKTGVVGVGDGIEYIHEIYSKGGIIPSGEPDWLNSSAEAIEIGTIIENGLRV